MWCHYYCPVLNFVVSMCFRGNTNYIKVIYNVGYTTDALGVTRSGSQFSGKNRTLLVYYFANLRLLDKILRRFSADFLGSV
jgi:hypothetical protein